MKHHYLIGLFFCFFMVPLLAQQQFPHIEVCGYNRALEQREKQQPGYLQAVDATHQQALKIAESMAARMHKMDTIYEIQVVVHVVFNPNQPGSNLDDSLIINQMKVLNATFGRTNADTIQVRPVFQDRIGQMPIKFVLARRDPNGRPTTGINRVETFRQSFFNPFNLDLVKRSTTGGVDAWDTKTYLNIWVCDLSVFGQDILLGFAYPPVGAPHWPSVINDNPELEGVVVHNKVFGSNNPLLPAGPIAVYNQGKTCVHEVGHYLGLRHIWGDGDCSEDDGIADTPDQDGSSDDCSGRNSCASSPEPDMFENYMDYSGDPCQVMFSKGQTDLMMANLLTFRSELAQPRYIGLSESIFTFGPIPVSKELAINFFPVGEQALKVAAYNVTGHLVLEKQFRYFDVGRLSLDVSMLAQGIYTFVFTYDGKPHVHKVVVARS
jgi:hypothetical protein